MNVGTNGIVVDQQGNVLLIKRNDTRTFAPPGGALNPGELPPKGAAREVREETGLIVLPVRLAAITFLPLSPNGYLGFTFRCLLRGGEIVASDESPLVGFFRTNPLPRRMSSFHRERVEMALTHAEERPFTHVHHVTVFTRTTRFLLRHVVYRWFDLRRQLRGQPPFQGSLPWEIDVRLICPNAAGNLLWHRTADGDWRLPGGIVSGLVPPWQTAVKCAAQQVGQALDLGHLNSVYIHPGASRLKLIFRAKCPAPIPKSDSFGWFTPGEEPANTLDSHIQAASGFSQDQSITQFHTLA